MCYPELELEWDAEKNGPLQFSELTVGSRRLVWWRCAKGHSYRSAVKSRTQETGCPVCAGQKVLSGFNDLTSLHPQLAEQWDRKKNGALTPETVSAYSNRRVWWRCDKGHSFCAVIAHRVNRESDCPYCTNRKVLPGFNDLESKEPVVASQWHPTLNGSFTPQQVTPGSSRKAWWENAMRGNRSSAAVQENSAAAAPVCAGRPLSQCTAILAGRPEKPTH